jgi:hypothetical protein
MHLTSVLLAVSVAFGCAAIAAPNDKPAEIKKPPQFIVTRTWPMGISEIEWRIDGKPRRALSNIDCSKLDSMFSFEKGGSNFEFQVLILKVTNEEVAQSRSAGILDNDGFPTHWPKQLIPQRNVAAHYFILPTANESAHERQEANLWLDALHLYWREHMSEIIAAWQQREAGRPFLEAEARAREERLRQEAQAPPTQVRVMSVEGPPPEARPAIQPRQPSQGFTK